MSFVYVKGSFQGQNIKNRITSHIVVAFLFLQLRYSYSIVRHTPINHGIERNHNKMIRANF